jgi:ATP-binding cassette, subfamily B, bacterial PglK
LTNYQSGNVVDVLPILGALALGAQRSLPLMQAIYGGWSSMLGSKAALVDVLELLDQPLQTQANLPEPEPLLLSGNINFKNISFQYGINGPPVLEGFNLTISKGSRLGIIGKTGSGKSTVLDLLMSLLEPTQGQVRVDDLPLNHERKRAWQKALAHVPQSIFLTDSTIAENIAFGIQPDQIDFDRVREVAKQAHISEFIESSPESYGTIVGERGVRLSGGQRQRIGIARALYKQASVLIFDEATSSLDNETEQSVMETIEGLSKDLTLVIIAHRLTTLKNCTQIVELGNGGIMRIGSYQDIVNLTAVEPEK